MKPIFLIITFVLICTSCAVKHQTIPEFQFENIEIQKFNPTDSLYYGYFKDLLKESNNKRLKRWAKRKDYTIIGFEVTNVSSNFTKGYQLKYFIGDQRIIPIRNEWIAKKARQKINGLGLLAIPVGLFEMVFRDAVYENYDIDIGEGAPVSMQMAEANNQMRKQANKELLNELVSREISDKVLRRGIPVYAIVILEGDIDLNNLEVKL